MGPQFFLWDWLVWSGRGLGSESKIGVTFSISWHQPPPRLHRETSRSVVQIPVASVSRPFLILIYGKVTNKLTFSSNQILNRHHGWPRSSPDPYPPRSSFLRDFRKALGSIHVVLDNVRESLPGASTVFGHVGGGGGGQCNGDDVLTRNASSYRYRAKKDGVSLLFGVFWSTSEF